MTKENEEVNQHEHYESMSCHSEPSVNQGDLDEEDPEIEIYFDKDGNQIRPIPAKPITIYDSQSDEFRPEILGDELPAKKRMRADEWIRQLLEEPFMRRAQVQVNMKEPSETGSNVVESSQDSNEGPGFDRMIALRHALDGITRGLREHTALHGRGFMIAWIQRVREAFDLDEIALDSVSNTDWTWAMLAAIPYEDLRQRAYQEIVEVPLPCFYSCLEKLRVIVHDMFPDE